MLSVSQCLTNLYRFAGNSVIDHLNHPAVSLQCYHHRIGWWENLQESPIFDGKNHGFRLRFSLKPIQCYQSSLKITNQQPFLVAEVMHPFWSFRCQLSPFEVCQDLRAFLDWPLQLDGDVFQRYEYVYTYWKWSFIAFIVDLAVKNGDFP